MGQKLEKPPCEGFFRCVDRQKPTSTPLVTRVTQTRVRFQLRLAIVTTWVVLIDCTIWPKLNGVAQIKILTCFSKPARRLCGLATLHFDRMANLTSVCANPSILIRSAVPYLQPVLLIVIEIRP
jgi:hypothetical protein